MITHPRTAYTKQGQRKYGAALMAVLIAFFGYATATEVTMLIPPAGADSSLSRLFVEQNSKLHLSWVTKKDERSSLFHAALGGQSWSKPSLISEGSNWFVNWADFPSLVVNNGRMTAHWLQKSASGTYDYDVRASFLDNRTNNWGDSVTINTDGVNAEHGFVSMLPMADGQTFITWLDGRNTSKSKESAKGHKVGGPMTIRAGVFDGNGNTVNEWELDDSTCDCCQTSAAMTDSGPVVAYRDRTEHEIRDVYTVRFVDDKWTTPVAVYNDNWQIAGCPVNGPAIASKNGLTAVAWFSAKDDQSIIRLAASSDDGANFGTPVTVAKGNTSGRVGIAILDSGNIAVSWLRTAKSGAQIQVDLFDADGRLVESVKVADTDASRRSGFPTIASVGSEAYVSWTHLADKPLVKVARIRF